MRGSTMPAKHLPLVDPNQEVIIIGAWADVRWNDSGEVIHRYFSFGDYDHKTDQDEFGIRDEHIFFYTGSSDEFEALTAEDNGEDFVVLEKTIVWEVRIA